MAAGLPLSASGPMAWLLLWSTARPAWPDPPSGWRSHGCANWLEESHRPGRDAAWLAGPAWSCWPPTRGSRWSVSFDFHEEGLAIAFVALLALVLSMAGAGCGRGCCRCWPAGAPTCHHVAGLGLGGVLAWRRARCLAPSCPSLASDIHCWSCSSTAISALRLRRSLRIPGRHRPRIRQQQAHLRVGLAEGHCQSSCSNARDTLWSNTADIVANLAPAGLLGPVFFSLLSPVLLLALLNRYPQPSGWSTPSRPSRPAH